MAYQKNQSSKSVDRWQLAVGSLLEQCQTSIKMTIVVSETSESDIPLVYNHPPVGQNNITIENTAVNSSPAVKTRKRSIESSKYNYCKLSISILSSTITEADRRARFTGNRSSSLSYYLHGNIWLSPVGREPRTSERGPAMQNFETPNIKTYKHPTVTPPIY